MKDASRSDPLPPRRTVLALTLLLGACGPGSPGTPEASSEASEERTSALVDDPRSDIGEERSAVSAAPDSPSGGSVDVPPVTESDRDRDDVRIAAAAPSDPTDVRLPAPAAPAAARPEPTSPLALLPESVPAPETVPDAVPEKAPDPALGTTGDTDSARAPEPVGQAAVKPAPATAPAPDPDADTASHAAPATDTVSHAAADLAPAADTASHAAADPAPAADTASHAAADPAPAPKLDTSAGPVSATEAIVPFAPLPESASAAAEPDTGAASESEPPRRFDSSTTPGFVGELLDDGTVRVSWPAEPDARGYNVYRQAKYVTTVLGPEFIDEDIFDSDYYYEVLAFDGASPARFSTIATGLTVRVRGLGRPDPDAKPSNEDMLDDYDLVFADEFDTGTLDASKWNTSFLWKPDVIINSEEQYYVDALRDPDFGFDPFTFENGALVINSVRTPPALLEKANGQPYLSGMITSYDAFKFTYGYVEARARVPYGRGYWPAFWLLNAYYVDDEPEIDIMEFVGDDQDVVYHTYHYYDADGTLRSTESEPTPGVDYTADFHTYAVDWRPGTIVYYIDGVEVHRISDARVSRQDMYVIANTAVGGWWAGPPDQSTPFPGRYEIDYIRVYRQTKPYGMAPLSDGKSHVEPADTVPGASPAHRPPFELWPEGYPGRR